jgi:hypothetical protein
MPAFSRSILKSPLVGCIRDLKVIPTATVLTRLGKNTIDLTIFLLLMEEVRRTAIARANITLRPLVEME